MKIADKIDSVELGCLFGCAGFAVAIISAVTGVLLWVVIHITNKF